MNRAEKLFMADIADLDDVLAFVDEYLEEAGCGMKPQMQIDIAVEEMFVNVARYAYSSCENIGPEDRQVRVSLLFEEGPGMFQVELMDKGTAFDPTAKPDPDITLPPQEREIGGLGIYMAKKNMDEMSYEYRDGKNILTMKKKLNG